MKCVGSYLVGVNDVDCAPVVSATLAQVFVCSSAVGCSDSELVVMSSDVVGF